MAWFVAFCILAASLLGGFLLPLQQANAATTSTLNFQARLESSTGAIVPDGLYNVEFKLYTASAVDGGETPIAGSCTTNPGAVADEDCVWTERYYDSDGAGGNPDNRVSVQNGYLTVNLGSQTSFPGTINWDQDLWIAMNIGGTNHTGTPTWDGEMSPRMRLTGVPYAFRAGKLATFNNSTSFTSTLELVQPTVGNQIFQVPNMAAAGTYTLCVQAAGCTASSGSGFYIQNQNASAQTTSNFWISGSGRADSSFLAPAFDVGAAGTLTFGNTNATTVNIATNAAAHVIGIGTGAADNDITIGSVTAGSTLSLLGSTSVTIGGAAATTYTIGETTTTGTTTIGRSTASNIVNVANGNIANAATQTVNIASGANVGTGSSVVNVGAVTSAGTATVTVGSLIGASTTTLQAGTGNFAVTGAAGTTYTIGTAATTGTITLGQSTASQTINLGNATIAAGNTGTINIGTSSTSTGKTVLTLGSTNAASSMLIQAGTGNLQIQSQGGTLGIGNNAVAQTLAIGNVTGATGVTISVGTNNFTVGGVAASTYTIGDTNTTGTTTIGRSTASNTIAIGNANVATGNTQTISIGSGANVGTGNTTVNVGAVTSAGTATVKVGSLVGTSTTTIQSGTGGINLTTAGAAADINLTTASTTSGTLVKTTTNSTTAFQVQNASSQVLVSADTVNSSVSLGLANVGTSLTVGSQTLTSNDSTNNNGNVIISGKYTTPGTAGTLTSISMYTGAIDPTAANRKFRMAIYTDTGLGRPSALVAQSAEGTLTANSWNTLAINASLSATTTYWLAYITNASGVGYNYFYYTSGAAGQYYSLAQAYGAFPASVASGGNGAPTIAPAFYGTYQSGSTYESVMTVSGSGNVGIGTSAPAAKLHVAGDALFKNVANSTAAVQVQNAAGNAVLTVDTTNSNITLGKASSVNGSLVFANSSNGNTLTINSGASGSNFTLTLPTADGASGDCLKDTNGSGVLGFASCMAAGSASYIQNQNASAQSTSVFWISGAGRSDTSFLAPAFDVAAAGTLSIGTATATTVNIATNAAAHTIAIGNGAGDNDITIGSTTAGSTLLLQGATSITMGGVAATTYTIGDTNTTGTTTIGRSTASNTIAIGNANVATGNTQTISIGSGANVGTGNTTVNVGAVTSAGTATVTVGSLIGASTTTIQAGTGNINLSPGGAGYTNIAAGGFRIGATEVMTSARVLQNVTTDASIINNGTGTLNVNRGGTGLATATLNGIVYGNGASAMGVTAAGTSGQCLMANTGAAPTWGACASVVSTNPTIAKHKSADETVNNSSAYQADNELFFSIGANETWVVDYEIMANSGTTPDFKFKVTAPAGATYCQIGVMLNGGTFAPDNCLTTGVSAAGEAADRLYKVSAVLTAGPTGGVVNFEWAQNTANLSNSTIYDGSYLKAHRVSGTGTTFDGFIQGGNSFAATGVLGTNDAQALNIVTGGATRIALGATGAITIGDTTTTGTLTLGQSTASQTINLGNATIAAGNTGTINIGTSSTSTGKTVLTLGSTNAASSMLIQAGTGNLQIQSQGGTLGIGNNAVAQTLAIGNATGATSVAVSCGTGTCGFGNNATAHTTAVGSSTSTSTTTISAGTGGLNVGNNGVANTIQIGNTTGAVTQTVNLGNNATASSVTNVTIGSLIGASATTLQAGTGNLNFLTNSATAGVIFKTSTDSTTAFQIQNAAGDSLFWADTSTAASNLLTNIGLETDATGWTATGTGASGARTTTGSEVFSGVGAFEVVLGSVANTGARITAAGIDGGTQPAGTYAFSFYAKGSVGLTGLAVVFNGGGTCTLNDTTVSANGYYRHQCAVTTTTATTQITISVTNTASTLYIDNVRLQTGGIVTPFNVGQLHLNGVLGSPLHIQNRSDSDEAFAVRFSTGSTLMKASTADGVIEFSGLGTTTGGSMQITSPGSNVGMVWFSEAGNRMDIQRSDSLIYIGASTSGSAPSATSGALYIENGGAVCINTSSCAATGIGVSGTGRASGGWTTNTPDIAEYITAAPDVQAWDVVAADPNGYEKVVKATADRRDAMVGVISDGTSGFMMMNAHYGQAFDTVHEEAAAYAKPMTLAGRIPVHVTNENGPIRPGDNLTVSATIPGYAMKATTAGATIGKSLGFFDAASGTVLTFIQVGYYDPFDGNNLQAQTGSFATLMADAGTFGNLNVGGLAKVGSLEVTGNALVRGDLVVGGKTTVQDIQIEGHITTRGAAPAIAIGQAAGQPKTQANGTVDATTMPIVTVDGTDSAGTVTVKSGFKGTAIGALAHLSFAKAYQTNYKVVISPTNGDANKLQAYIIKTATGFDIYIDGQPSPTTEYQFDYIVVGAEVAAAMP